MSTKNINRIDTKSTHGWQVRIMRDNKNYSKFFSDSKHDSREDALKAAQDHRDKLLEQWEKFAKRPDRSIKYRKTNTGHFGISLSIDQRQYQLIFNYTDENDKYWAKTFYVNKKADGTINRRTYKEKLKEAIEYRDKKLTGIYGARYINWRERWYEKHSEEDYDELPERVLEQEANM